MSTHKPATNLSNLVKTSAVLVERHHTTRPHLSYLHITQNYVLRSQRLTAALLEALGHNMVMLNSRTNKKKYIKEDAFLSHSFYSFLPDANAPGFNLNVLN